MSQNNPDLLVKSDQVSCCSSSYLSMAAGVQRLVAALAFQAEFMPVFSQRGNLLRCATRKQTNTFTCLKLFSEVL